MGRRRGLFCAVCGFMLVASQTPCANAGFQYDFENLVLDHGFPAPLTGQDQWFTAVGPGIQGSAYVDEGGVDRTQYAVNRGGAIEFSYDANLRPLETPLTYGNEDTAAVFMLDASANISTGYLTTAIGGPVFSAAAQSTSDAGPLIFGLIKTEQGGTARGLRSYLSGAGDGDTLASNHLYQFQLVVDFHTQSASLFYRDLTAGEATFTEDSVLQNVMVGIPAQIATVHYAFLDVGGGTGGALVDDFYFSSPVPEPVGVLATSGAVLVVLWRRRRAI